MHQPLFGNAKMCNQHGLSWGTKTNYKLCIWVTKGIQHLEDLWNEEKNEWQTINHFTQQHIMGLFIDKEKNYHLFQL